MGSLRVLLIQKYRNHKNNRVEFQLAGIGGEVTLDGEIHMDIREEGTEGVRSVELGVQCS